VIDVVMVAKKCTYETSKKICQRLFQDYWNMDPNGITEQTDLSSQLFRSLRLQQGRNGGQATLCANAAAIGEILILIPGCELSANLRKDMVRSFLGSGGAVTFQSLLANPRIRDHLRKESDNPMVDLVEKEELRMQLHNVHTSLDAIKTDISAFTQRPHFDLDAFKTWVMTEWGQALCTSLSQAVCFSLSQKFKDLRDEIREVFSNPTGSFIEALRKAVKLPAMRRTCDSDLYPEDQRVTPDEERFAESLSTVLTQELERLAAQRSLPQTRGLPTLTYGAWKSCRKLIGGRCLALRKLTGDASKPLLWTTSAGPGGRFNGGGQHYVYLSQCRSQVGGNAVTYIRKVLKQKLKNRRTSPTVEEHIRTLISTTPPETWPLSSSNVDYFPHDPAEERMGAEMAD
jgi:hypothetical protein